METISVVKEEGAIFAKVFLKFNVRKSPFDIFAVVWK